MRRSRSTAVAALCCVLGMAAGATTAANQAGAVRNSEAVRGRIVIDCEGGMRFGPPGPAHGTCTITGAITDRGWFRDDAVRWIHPHGRTFRSMKGTIEMSVYEERGHWRITSGTGRYAGLRGRGYEALFLRLPGRLSFTMTGTVSQPTERPEASATGALQGKVRIHLSGTLSGPQFRAFGRGRFSASGAFTDRGTFVDEFHGIHPPAEPHDRALRGKRGTILIEVDRTGNWTIARGTKAYAGLRGRGALQGRYRFTGIDATMIGTVSQ